MQKHSSSSWEKEPRRGERMNTTESEVFSQGIQGGTFHRGQGALILVKRHRTDGVCGKQSVIAAT